GNQLINGAALGLSLSNCKNLLRLVLIEGLHQLEAVQKLKLRSNILKMKKLVDQIIM
ncbi:hypothetical protein ABPG73_006408, partial [Tetrahymena malaccensis]